MCWGLIPAREIRSLLPFTKTTYSYLAHYQFLLISPISSKDWSLYQNVHKIANKMINHELPFLCWTIENNSLSSFTIAASFWTCSTLIAFKTRLSKHRFQELIQIILVYKKSRWYERRNKTLRNVNSEKNPWNCQLCQFGISI